MTTIAYRAGVMACDSCFSDDGRVDTLSNKIHRLPGGALLGQAGANDGRPLIKLLSKTRSIATLPTYECLMAVRVPFTGLLAFPDGRMAKVVTTMAPPESWSDEDEADYGAWEVEGAFAAIGTGADLALGAMEAGADAVQAVHIACRRDMQSRPPVRIFRLPSARRRT